MIMRVLLIPPSYGGIAGRPLLSAGSHYAPDPTDIFASAWLQFTRGMATKIFQRDSSGVLIISHTPFMEPKYSSNINIADSTAKSSPLL
jgi:hypothetical protein